MSKCVRPHPLVQAATSSWLPCRAGWHPRQPPEWLCPRHVMGSAHPNQPPRGAYVPRELPARGDDGEGHAASISTTLRRCADTQARRSTASGSNATGRYALCRLCGSLWKLALLASVTRAHAEQHFGTLRRGQNQGQGQSYEYPFLGEFSALPNFRPSRARGQHRLGKAERCNAVYRQCSTVW